MGPLNGIPWRVLAKGSGGDPIYIWKWVPKRCLRSHTNPITRAHTFATRDTHVCEPATLYISEDFVLLDHRRTVARL